MKMRRLLPLFGSTILLGGFLRAQVLLYETSFPSGLVPANGPSYSPATSADGRFQVFTSSATSFVASDLNGFADVFVLDTLTWTYDRVSVDSNEVEANLDSGRGSISADGRYVAFESNATNLVPGDTNGVTDVFVRDRTTGTTIRASVGPIGAQGNGPSTRPVISADGRYVAFLSSATTLVPGDTNGSATDVLVRDLQTGTTTRVDVDSSGIQGNASCGFVSMSPDGRWVLFSSSATNLVPSDTNGSDDLFLRDQQLNTTERVSVGASSVQGNGSSTGGRISSDGRFVAFWSDADNLVAGDTNWSTDVFLRDRLMGTTQRLSVDSGGVQGNQASDGCSISGDGRYVVFESYSTNLVAGDTNGVQDVFLRDRQAGTTRRLSVDENGMQGNATSGAPAISTDGRFVAFWSVASNLNSFDTNGVDDVFLSVGNTQQGSNPRTERVSVDSNEAQANGVSQAPSLSADGRYVAFESDATNLVAGDTNGLKDVFVRDRLTGVTERVSVATGGAQANGQSQVNYRSSISADGRYVVFYSDAPNLVAGDTNGWTDVFVRDRVSGTTERVSVDSAGNQGNGSSLGAWISADGRYVAFSSLASNLVPGDTNGWYDVFLRDRQLGLTERISVDSLGVGGNGNSDVPFGSPDGRFIVFNSYATNLVPGDTNGDADVFLRDRQTGSTERVSIGALGLQGTAGSFNGVPSADGRFVAFTSFASFGIGTGAGDVYVRDRTTNTLQIVDTPLNPSGALNASMTPDGRFVTFDTFGAYTIADWNGNGDSYLVDRDTGMFELESSGGAGEIGDGPSRVSVVSADGRCVAFWSEATNLVSGDTNGVRDIFVRERYALPVLTILCEPGIGGVRTCACSNPPIGPGRGCNNSAATGGAMLTAAGGSRLSSDTVVFTTSGEKPTATSVVWQGTATVTGVVFGQGVRCVGGTLKRLYQKNAVGGSVNAPNFGAGDLTVSARSATLGSPIAAGSTRYYFVTYRDPVVLGGCPTGSTFNVTQAGAVTWWP